MTARPRFAQFCLQFLLLLSPARVLRLRSFVERSAVFFDVIQSCRVIAPGLLERGFGCGDGPLAAPPFFLAVSLFLAALAVAPLLLLLERPRGLARCLVVDCFRRRLRPLRRTLCRHLPGGAGGKVGG